MQLLILDDEGLVGRLVICPPESFHDVSNVA